jgi:hypothetical protein
MNKTAQTGMKLKRESYDQLMHDWVNQQKPVAVATSHFKRRNMSVQRSNANT